MLPQVRSGAQRRAARPRSLPQASIALSATLTAVLVDVVLHTLGPPPATRLADEFQRLDLTRWGYGAAARAAPKAAVRASAEVRGGALEIHLVPAPPGRVAYTGIHAARPYDMRDRWWAVEVDPSGLRPVRGIELKFRVTRRHLDDYVSIEYGNRRIFFLRKFRGVLSQERVPYDPVRDRWWRIRHEQRRDLIFWETSADGREWRVRHVDISGFALTKVVPELYAGTYMPVAEPGTARFLTLRSGSTLPDAEYRWELTRWLANSGAVDHLPGLARFALGGLRRWIESL